MAYIAPDGEKLGARIKVQRDKYKSSKLSRLQIEKLEAIGMVWSPNDADWEKGYNHALEYYKAHRNLEMKSTYVTEEASIMVCGFRIRVQHIKKKGFHRKELPCLKKQV